MKSEKKTIEEINLETEQRIAKAVQRFEAGEIKAEEFERIVGAITLVGMQEKQKLSSLSGKVSKLDFAKFLKEARVI